MLVPQVRVVRRAPKVHPCPSCGKRARRKRSLPRRVYSLAYRQAAYLDVHYAEYRPATSCVSSTSSRTDINDLIVKAVRRPPKRQRRPIGQPALSAKSNLLLPGLWADGGD